MMNFKGKKAQTALELAVFGSILIFVMGATIRTVTGRAQQQNALLRATRMALSISHSSTETKEMAGRNMGSVLIVEDRLAAASSKYGTIDRMPFMMHGSGIHSVNLFMPIDYGDDEDLPVFDMYVNGKHFAFRTAAFKYVDLANSCANAAPCHTDCVDETGALDCSNGSPYFYRGADVPAGPEYWEDACFSSIVTTTTTVPCADHTPPCPPLDCISCDSDSLESYQSTTEVISSVGCAKLYTIVNNHPLIPQWCVAACPENLSADERFDLDREDLDAIDPFTGVDIAPALLGDKSVPPGERLGFAWQWFLVAPVIGEWQDTTLNYDVARLTMDPLTNLTSAVSSTVDTGEGMVLPGGENPPKNTSLDVDYDLKMENVMPNVKDGVQPNIVASNGMILQLGVMDSQEGDIDFTHNDSDELGGVETFGFVKDINLYTSVRGGGAVGGTYLQIDEGQLYSSSGDTRQYIRTASKKDQVDLVERFFQMNNNTGGYCLVDEVTGTISLQSSADFSAHYGISPAELNPVEICSPSAAGCFTSANIDKTCMDVSNNMIYIRSRLQDLHGRKWVTDESEDPFVDFVIE